MNSVCSTLGNTTYIGILSGINYSICFIYTYFTNGLQQHQKPLSFEQSPKESVTDEQTLGPHLILCFFRTGGYSIYEDRKSNVFNPGETFLLYVEPQVIHMVQ